MAKDKAQASRGRKGGLATKELYGIEHFRKAAKKRHKKDIKKKAE